MIPAAVTITIALRLRRGRGPGSSGAPPSTVRLTQFLPGHQSFRLSSCRCSMQSSATGSCTGRHGACASVGKKVEVSSRAERSRSRTGFVIGRTVRGLKTLNGERSLRGTQKVSVCSATVCPRFKIKKTINKQDLDKNLKYYLLIRFQV